MPASPRPRGARTKASRPPRPRSRELAPTVAKAAARPRCICDRAASPLWKEGIPALQILTFASDDDLGSGVAPKEERPGSPRFELDVAAVNDGARPLRDVRVTLTFARRNKAGRRVGAVDRGLFWGGLLAPGHAVKWHVRAPGSEMRIDASVTGTLDDAGLEPAPAAAFAELTRSRYRAVRAHAALMLAYLHDPRGREAALALDGRTPEDRLLLARIARAASPVIACDAKIEDDRLGICVFNGASQPRSQLELRALPGGVAALPDRGDDRGARGRSPRRALRRRAARRVVGGDSRRSLSTRDERSSTEIIEEPASTPLIQLDTLVACCMGPSGRLKRSSRHCAGAPRSSSGDEARNRPPHAACVCYSRRRIGADDAARGAHLRGGVDHRLDGA